jgi:hypothetical protein
MYHDIYSSIALRCDPLGLKHGEAVAAAGMCPRSNHVLTKSMGKLLRWWHVRSQNEIPVLVFVVVPVVVVVVNVAIVIDTCDGACGCCRWRCCSWRYCRRCYYCCCCCCCYCYCCCLPSLFAVFGCHLVTGLESVRSEQTCKSCDGAASIMLGILSFQVA